VTRELMRESADLARRLGLRLHTHLAETVEEEAYCVELYGCSPVDYLEQLGWVAGDVWCAHCVHLSGADVGAFGRAGLGVAHCPTSNLRLGAGVAPVRELLDAGAPVGLGVDGSASNERSDLFFEVKQALLVARGRGGPQGFRPGDAGSAGVASSPRAMTVRDALRLGTRGGATSGSWPRASGPTSRSGGRTGSSSAARTRTRSRASSCRRRTGSTGSTSAARRSSATATSSAPTRRRSPESTGGKRRGSFAEALVPARPRCARRVGGSSDARPRVGRESLERRGGR
jgi:hypothetical protein